MLRERVDRARWKAIVLGFADVLLILQPAADVAVRVLFLRALRLPLGGISLVNSLQS